jgi:hypothetical protein
MSEYYDIEIKENIFPSSLKFDWKFNQEIKENVLPNSLTHLKFGYIFNQEIKENVLPTSLTHLLLGYSFNNKIFFPKSLIELDFFAHTIIINNIPEYIENITLRFVDSYEKITNLPSSIKKIKIDDPYKINLIEKIPFGCIIEYISLL